MSHKLIPVDQIARAVSGTVSSVLSQVVEETSADQPESRSHDSDIEDFQVPDSKRRKGSKGKYV